MKTTINRQVAENRFAALKVGDMFTLGVDSSAVYVKSVKTMEAKVNSVVVVADSCSSSVGEGLWLSPKAVVIPVKQVTFDY